MASQSFKRSAQLAVAGALAVGAFAATAAPASADPITIPGVGTFEVPGVSIPQLPVIPGITDIAPAAPAAPISSVGEQAVRAAESKLGSPYVYGAARRTHSTAPVSFSGHTSRPVSTCLARATTRLQPALPSHSPIFRSAT